jgi:hypothetical protein
MKQALVIALLVTAWLNVGLVPKAFGTGELIGGDDTGCYGVDPSNITFTSARFTYVFTGSCHLLQTRANLPVVVPWTGVGTYDPPTGHTAEDIIVPAPRIDQPSRPYGRFQATMHCSRDPWLNPDVKCDHIAPTVYAPLDNTPPNAIGYKQPFPLGPWITGSIQQTGRPYTSMLTQDAVNKLNQQYGAFDAQQKAERQKQKFQHELQMKPGLIRPRGIEGSEPAHPPEPASPEPGSGTSR